MSFLRKRKNTPEASAFPLEAAQNVRSVPVKKGEPCLFPDKMRYSIESLGGNVGLTIEKLMGLHLEWMEEGHLPHHFVLVCGLLLP